MANAKTQHKCYRCGNAIETPLSKSLPKFRLPPDEKLRWQWARTELRFIREEYERQLAGGLETKENMFPCHNCWLDTVAGIHASAIRDLRNLMNEAWGGGKRPATTKNKRKRAA
jgi:hypothetical protein